MTRRAPRPSRPCPGGRRPARAAARPAAAECGQATSEYLTLSGVIALVVIVAMTQFVRPVALTFAALFRGLVLYVTSPPG